MDKETKADARQEGNAPGKPDSDDIKLPGNSGGPLPDAMTHREPNSALTKADK